jgi:hypothetical protein
MFGYGYELIKENIMPTPIPEEINYLSGVIDKLSEFDPEDLGGDNPEAMDLVEKAIQPIIDGMSDSEATEVIKKHCQFLQGWLQQPGMSESPAFYIQGAMLGMLAFKYGDYSALMGSDE